MNPASNVFVRNAFRQVLPVLLWLLPLAFLVVFFFYPMAAIFDAVIKEIRQTGIQSEISRTILRPLWFTTWQAALSTLLTLMVGLPASWVVARFTFPGKRLLQVLTTLPFILPTVVVAAGFNALLGPNGWINQVLVSGFHLSSPPIQILNSLGAILLAHVFYNTTVVIRLVGSAWARLDPRQEAAGRVLGASPLRNFWEVTLPLLRTPLLGAILLVFLFDFTSFGVILLLGGPRFATLEVEIYIQAVQMLNLPLAGLLSAVQLICTLLLTILSSRLGGQARFSLSPRLMGEGQRPPRRPAERMIVAGIILFILVLLVLPLVALAFRSIAPANGSGLSLAAYAELFINRRESLFYVPPIAAARNSLFFASITVCISVSLGILAAYAIQRRSMISRWIDPILMLPLGASAVTLGLGFLVAFSAPPINMITFPLLLPIAHSLVALPFVVRTLQPALASIPANLRHSAAVLGASRWQVWWEVDRPVLGRAALVSAMFAFTISLGEFGATSFLSRPDMPTLPVAIFRFLGQPGSLNYGQALAMATLLMLVCGVSLWVMESIGEHSNS